MFIISTNMILNESAFSAEDWRFWPAWLTACGAIGHFPVFVPAGG